MRPISTNESALRSRARRLGYAMHKSRRSESIDNRGGFMLVDAARNTVAAGSRYDLDLEDVAQFLGGDGE